MKLPSRPAPSPKPMPITSSPDRCDYSQHNAGEAMKAGLRSSNELKVTNGRPPEGEKNSR